MKDIKQAMANMQNKMQSINDENQQKEELKKRVSDNAKLVIDDLFNELKSCYPAWRQAFETRDTWNAAKKTWTKAFIENNISTTEQVRLGLAEARKGTNPFWPSVGQFINWCDGPQIDTDEAFNRMIAKKPCNGIAEWESRQEVGFRCKCSLPEDKARALWKTTLTKNIQRVRNGELIEQDFNPVQMPSPEKFRDTESPEMRNSRLDAEIGIMLSKGQRLIGPYKKRYLETKASK